MEIKTALLASIIACACCFFKSNSMKVEKKGLLKTAQKKIAKKRKKISCKQEYAKQIEHVLQTRDTLVAKNLLENAKLFLKQYETTEEDHAHIFEVLQKIREQVILDAKKTERELKCPACNKDMDESSLHILVCGHVFCSCVQHWLHKRNTCPLCKKNTYEAETKDVCPFLIKLIESTDISKNNKIKITIEDDDQKQVISRELLRAHDGHITSVITGQKKVQKRGFLIESGEEGEEIIIVKNGKQCKKNMRAFCRVS